MDRELLRKINELKIPNFLYYYGDFAGNILYVREGLRLIDPEYMSDYQKLQYELANLYLHSKLGYLIDKSILYLEKHEEVYIKYDNKYLYCPDGILKIEISNLIKGEPNTKVLDDLIGKINGSNRYKTPQKIWKRGMISSIESYGLSSLSQREVEGMLDKDIKIDFLGNEIILNKDNYRQLLTNKEIDSSILAYLQDQINKGESMEYEEVIGKPEIQSKFEEVIGKPKIQSKSGKSTPLATRPTSETVKRSIPPSLSRPQSPLKGGSYTKFQELD